MSENSLSIPIQRYSRMMKKPKAQKRRLLSYGKSSMNSKKSEKTR